MSALGVFSASFLVAFMLTPVFRRLAWKYGALDLPSQRKMNRKPMPLLGGVVLYLALFIPCVIYIAAQAGEFGQGGSRFLAVLIGGTVLVAVGIIDDLVGCRPWTKLLVQVAASLVLVAFGIRIEILTNPFGEHMQLGWLSVPVTVLWVVLVTNAMNLIDGLDGLASGIAAIAALTLFWITGPGEGIVSVLALCLAGASLGFLRHNFPPARIYLGDAGSMLLGFILAVIAIEGSLKGPTTAALLFPLVALGVPLIDTALSVFRRSASGRPLFHADDGHLHHRLIRIGLSHRDAVLLLYLLSTYLSLSAYTLAKLHQNEAAIMIGGLLIAGFVLLRGLGFVEDRVRETFEAIRRQESLFAPRMETRAEAFARWQSEVLRRAEATAGEGAEPVGPLARETPRHRERLAAKDAMR